MLNSDAASRPDRRDAGTAPSGHRLGPYSRVLTRGAIGASISGSSREGRFLRHYEAELTRHVGSQPSIVERLMIARCARLALRLELLDERSIDGDMTERDGKHYLAWSRALVAMLRGLGTKGAPKPKTTLQDVLAQMGQEGTRRAAAPSPPTGKTRATSSPQNALESHASGRPARKVRGTS